MASDGTPVTCSACKVGRREPHRIAVLVDRGDRLVVVRGVPAVVCSFCDWREFTEEALGQVARFTADAAQPEIPVVRARCYQFDAGREG